MNLCECQATHHPRRIVLTGGPGAGKTAVLEILSHEICPHVVIAPEAAGILFAGGFPRGRDVDRRRATQRAIYHVQRELEAIASLGNPALVLFDRGIVDGAAYWPGPEDFWDAIGLPRTDAIGSYDAVVHMRVPDGPNGYGHQNPLRIETVEEARLIDERIFAAWNGHPCRFVVEASTDFVTKAKRALDYIRAQIPGCCARPHSRLEDVEPHQQNPRRKAGRTAD